MPVRVAPAGGYDFGAKRDYRRRVWGTLLEDLPQGDSKVVLLPSAEGDEVDHLLKRGVPRSRLVVVDRNPAIAATLSRRYGVFKAYGCDIGLAFERMAKDGIRVAAANVDLCGPVSTKLSDVLFRIVASEVLLPQARVAVTMMKGRETGEALEDVREFKTHHHQSDMPNTPPAVWARIVATRLMLMPEFDSNGEGVPDTLSYVTRWGEYPSGSRLKMIWAAFLLHKQPCPCEHCFCTMSHFAGTCGVVSRFVPGSALCCEGTDTRPSMEQGYVAVAQTWRWLRGVFGRRSLDTAFVEGPLSREGDGYRPLLARYTLHRMSYKDPALAFWRREFNVLGGKARGR